MTQLIPSNLPIYFQCLCVPVKWERKQKLSMAAFPNLANLAALLGNNVPGQQDRDLLKVEILPGPARTFDPWEKRNEFFRLVTGDTEDLLTFLSGVGLFERPGFEHLTFNEERAFESVPCTTVSGDAGKTHQVTYLPTTSEGRIWALRGLLENTLRKPEGWTGKYADFQVRIIRSKGEARVIITTTTFLESLLLTLCVDQVQGAKVRKCARPDCGIPFSTTGGHKKKYCTWYCGHIESVRRSRKRRRKFKGVANGK